MTGFGSNKLGEFTGKKRKGEEWSKIE